MVPSCLPVLVDNDVDTPCDLRESEAVWEALPLDLLATCFASLNLDERAAAAAACVNWRRAASAPHLWETVELGACAPGVRRRVTDSIMLGLVRRAQSSSRVGLARLDASGCARLTSVAVLAAAQAAGGSLRSLTCRGPDSPLFTGGQALTLDSACGGLQRAALGFTLDSISGALLLLRLCGRRSWDVLNLQLAGLPLLAGADAVALASALRAQAPRLRLLSLRGCRLGDAAACALVGGLRGHAALQELDLSGTSVGPPTAAALAAALSAAAAGDGAPGLALSGLHLDSNSLFASGAASLAAALALPRCALTQLTLRRCSLGAAGARSLARALAASRGVLRELDLTENGLGDSGAIELADAVLAGCRSGPSAEAAVMARAPPGRPLSTRLLAWAAVQETAAELGRGCALASLRLGRNGLTDECCVQLAAALGAGNRLCLLDLKQNEVGERGAAALLAVLEARLARGGGCDEACCTLTGNCVSQDFVAALEGSPAAASLLLFDQWITGSGAAARAADKEERFGDSVTLHVAGDLSICAGDFALQPQRHFMLRRRRRLLLTVLATLVVMAAITTVFLIHLYVHPHEQHTRPAAAARG